MLVCTDSTSTQAINLHEQLEEIDEVKLAAHEVFEIGAVGVIAILHVLGSLVGIVWALPLAGRDVTRHDLGDGPADEIAELVLQGLRVHDQLGVLWGP